MARSYKTPLTLRVFDALPGGPVWIGLGFAIALLAVFFIGRSFFDLGDRTGPNDARIAIIHLLQMAYGATAYAYLLVTARTTTRELAPVAGNLPDWQLIVDRAGRHRLTVLILVGLVSVVTIGVLVTEGTTEAETNPWDWRKFSYDVYWHRFATVFMIWWMACLSYTMVVESRRLSDLTSDVDDVDLFDLHLYRPLIRQGLTNALLVLGFAGLLSLLLIEDRYIPLLVGAWISFVVFAWIVLMLPLRGIRRKIRLAKEQELDWCRQTLKIRREELKSGVDAGRSISEIIAYSTMVEDIRNWPFDNPTLARFMLYLLIPLGSWLGGAFVERGLDLFLG